MHRLLCNALLVVVPALAALGCSSNDGSSISPDDGAAPLADASAPDGGALDASDGAADGGASGCQAMTTAIGPTLDAAAKDTTISDVPDFTLLLETEDGRSYAHSQGASSATKVYESASTSKLITAVVILELVDQGLLTLDTKAHDLLPFWTETTVTLRHLLSFTDGFFDEPPCVNVGAADFETCVAAIYTKNSATAPAAGTRFQYSSTHLQVAGLMAMKATNLASWTAVFDAWKAKTKLFPTAVYDLPSASNPRLAGGVHWTGSEYLGFLRALAKGQILKPATRVELFADQRGSAIALKTPAFSGLGEDWSYGLGNWLECPGAKQVNSFNCGAGHRNSSAGAYGAYPFIDFDHHYFGILARQGGLGTGFQGVNIVRAAEGPITQWADCK